MLLDIDKADAPSMRPGQQSPRKHALVAGLSDASAALQ